MTSIVRRAFLMDPGENLLLSDSAVVAAGRFGEFVQETGLNPDHVLGDPLCAMPIPVRGLKADGTLERLTGMNPSLLWHPLAWLPIESAFRFQIRVEGSDELELESDHDWALRIALELTTSGLYDVEDGTWLDVLALHGVDIENPVDAARVEAWLAGAVDEDLDGIDLSDFIAAGHDDPEWSYRAAAGLAELAIPAQWSILAKSLTESLDGEGQGITDPPERQRLLTAITELGILLLGDVPSENVDSPEAPVDELIAVHDRLTGEGTDVTAADLATAERDLVRTLNGVAELFKGFVEALKAINTGTLALEPSRSQEHDTPN